MLVLTYFTMRKFATGREVSNSYTGFVVLWLAYVSVVYESGLARDFSLPPRVPLLIILPAFVLIIWGTGRPRFRPFISGTPPHVFVYIQAFRVLVEVLIYGAFLIKVFPRRTTFEGLNFDILVGISALFVGWAVQKGRMGRRGILIWNIAALAVLSLTGFSFITAYFFLEFPAGVDQLAFTRLPYWLLPAVLLPCAVFYHVLSIRQQLAG